MTTSPKAPSKPGKFTASDVPSQAGRTFVVTGANSGIGRIAAGVLAAKGARVILAVRNLVKGQDAADTMTGDVEVRQLDLSDLTSVRAFAAEFTDPSRARRTGSSSSSGPTISATSPSPTSCSRRSRTGS